MTDLIEKIDRVTDKTTKAMLHNILKEARKTIRSLQDNKIQNVVNDVSDEPIATADILQHLSESKQSITARLAAMENEFLSLAEDLEKAHRSVEAKENRLKELFGIEKEMMSLATTIEALKLARDEAAQERAEIKKNNESLRKELQSDFERRKLELAQEYDDTKRENDFEQKRLELAWKDSFEQRKYEEERRLRMSQQEKIDVLDKREQELEDREQHLSDLEGRIESIEGEIADRIQEEVSKAVTSEKRSNSFEVSTLKKQNEYETSLLQQRIDQLEDQVERLAEEKASMSEKLEAAQARVQEIATESVKSARPQVITHESSEKR